MRRLGAAVALVALVLTLAGCDKRKADPCAHPSSCTVGPNGNTWQ